MIITTVISCGRALTVLSVGLLICSPVQSQVTTEPKDEEQPESLTTVVVTGSHIRRTDLESAVPISIINQGAMEIRNASLPVELLTSLPSVVNLPENETRLGSSGARGDNANLNLRNMGATATLVLVNGRRMAVNPMTAGLSQAVNVNQLPTFGVERIEVLRDGASAVYGSDAVGGVINYVMKRQFEGVEATLRYGQPEEGGGVSRQAGLIFGTTFADGRGQVFGTIEGLLRDYTLLTDRDFSRTSYNIDRAPAPFNVPGGPFDQRSARGYWPTFRIGTSSSSTYFRPVNGVPALTTIAPSRATNPEFFLDFNQFGFAAPEVKRGTGWLSGQFEITPALTAFSDFSVYRADSLMRRQPLALNAPTSDKLMVMPIDNPYNPYGSRFYSLTGAPNTDGTLRLTGAPRAVSFTAMTLLGVAPESVDTSSKVVRFDVGLRGQFARTWEWEGSLFFNQVEGRDSAYPDVRESRLQTAIGRTDASAYNPFGYTFKVAGGAVVADQPYTNPQSVIDSFTEAYLRNARSRILSADLRANGTLVSLWGRDVLAAVGIEHRREELRDVRPPFHGENPVDSGLETTNNDFLLHPPRPDVFGKRDVTSAYGEMVLPLVTAEQQLPLMRNVELSVSARYENYSDFGQTTKPKVGINWRPFQALMLRGSFNRGFMAPSLAALYTSPRWSISAGAGDIDTYRNPYLNEGPYVVRTYFGGNPNLKPQESDGVTFGFVFDVPGAQGLSLTADLWKISRTGLLGSRNATQINTSDTALLQAYTKAQLAAGVPLAQIDLGSGSSAYKGDPDVQRYPVTAEDRAAFAAYNSANPASPAAVVGRIFSRNTPFLNLSSSEHKGMDVSLRYAMPRQSWGELLIDSEWSFLDRATTVLQAANAPTVVNENLYAAGAARLRSTTNINWRQGPWSLGLGIFYVGKTHDAGATTTAAVYESLNRPSYIEPYFTGGQTVYRLVIDPVISYNAAVGYRIMQENSWLRDARIRLTVANITNRQPPLSAAGSDNFGYDPSVGQGLMPGRTWSLELTRKF